MLSLMMQDPVLEVRAQVRDWGGGLRQGIGCRGLLQVLGSRAQVCGGVEGLEAGNWVQGAAVGVRLQGTGVGGGERA